MLQIVYAYTSTDRSLAFTLFGVFPAKMITKSSFLSTHHELTKLFNRRYMLEKL